MNVNVETIEFDVFRWIGSIPEIIGMIASDRLFGIVAAAVAVAAAFLIFFQLTRGDRV